MIFNLGSCLIESFFWNCVFSISFGFFEVFKLDFSKLYFLHWFWSFFGHKLEDFTWLFNCCSGNVLKNFLSGIEVINFLFTVVIRLFNNFSQRFWKINIYFVNWYQMLKSLLFIFKILKLLFLWQLFFEYLLKWFSFIWLILLQYFIFFP